MDKPKKRLKRENRTEWSERVVAIQRVTKVVKGGKKMSFRAIIVVGNEQGKVGVGVGKAGDVITAVKKGVTDGKKNVIQVRKNYRWNPNQITKKKTRLKNGFTNNWLTNFKRYKKTWFKRRCVEI